MPTSAIALGAMAVSTAVWTFAEYAFHRWAFHRRVPRWWKTPIAHEHLVHHAEPNTTSPAKRAIAWLAIVALGAVVTMLLVAVGLPYLVAAGALAGWSSATAVTNSFTGGPTTGGCVRFMSSG